MQEITIENIEARLIELSIFELRQTARAVGVERAADGKKSEVRASAASMRTKSWSKISRLTEEA